MKDKILILDDDLVYAEYLKTILVKDIDADIVIENDPLNAIEKMIKGEEYSLIILDIRMPLIDGFESAKKIRELNFDMPIILLTGFTSEIISNEKMKDAEISDIVHKSNDIVSNSLLINKIKIFLERHKYLKKKRREDEGRYKRVFDNAVVAIWEEDISKTKEMIDGLSKKIGAENVEEYLIKRPEFVERALDSIIVKQLNKKAISMFEASSCSHLKKSLKTTFTENSYEVFRKMLVAIAMGNREFNSEVQYKTLKGTRFDAAIYVNIPDNISDFSCVAFSMVDISNMKELERKQKDLYNTITRSPAIIMSLSPTDTYFKIDYISENIYDLLGYTADDFMTNKITIRAICHQEDFEKQKDFAKEQISLRVKEFTSTFRLYTKNHDIRWIKLVAYPCWDINNVFLKINCILSDITSEVTLHNKLLDSINKWKMLIESTNTAYIILNENGLIIEANNKMIEMLGCKTVNDLLGRSPRSIVAEQDISKYDAAIKKLINGESVDNLELSIHSNDFFICKAAWVSLNAGLIENGHKKIFCLMRDITDIKVEELKKYISSQKNKDKLQQSIFKLRNKIQDMTVRSNKLKEEDKHAN